MQQRRFLTAPESPARQRRAIVRRTMDHTIVVRALVGCLAAMLPAQQQQQQPSTPDAPRHQSLEDEALRARVEALEHRLQQYESGSSSGASQADFAPALVPFAWGDFRWMPGSYAPPDTPLKYGAFTGEVRVDAAYHYSFNSPADNTISGSSEVFRHNELQITQLGVGGDFYYKGVMAR